MANKNYYLAKYHSKDGTEHQSPFSSPKAFEQAIEVFDYKATLKEKRVINHRKIEYIMCNVDNGAQFTIYLYKRCFNNGAFLIHFE